MYVGCTRDWLESAGYTMAEAIERVGAKWLALIPEAERIMRDEDRGGAA